MSFWSSVGALAGLKKSAVDRLWSALTCRRTTDSDRVPCGVTPGWVRPGPGAGLMPLPVARKIRPEPSDISPPPDCQMPPPWLLEPTSVAHIEVSAALVVLTPTT